MDVVFHHDSHRAGTDLLDRNLAVERRLNAWRSVFERLNRIISEQPVKVVVARKPNRGMESVAGWSDGEVIYFNGPLTVDMLKSRDPIEAVLRLKGLNYHELSHVLFTPRKQNEPMTQIVKRSQLDQKWFYAFNALEDQRIETLFTALYAPSRRYFEAMVLEWVVKEGTAEAAILLDGRKYLPARIRAQAKRVFIKKYGEDLYNRFKKVIDEYLTVSYPKEATRGLVLVSKYRDLLNEMQDAHFANLPKLPIEDNGSDCNGETVSNKGQPNREVAAEARERVEAQRHEAEKEDAEAEAQLDKEAQQGSPKSGNGEAKVEDEDGDEQNGGEDGSSDGGEATDDIDQDGDGESDSGSLGAGGDGIGSEGSGQHETLTEDDLADEVRRMIEMGNDSLDEIMEDDDILAEANEMLDAVKDAIGSQEGLAEGEIMKVNQTITPTPEALIAVRKTMNILRRLKQEAEPDVHLRQTQGRLDTRRVVNAKPEEFDIFRAYFEGAEDETGLEVVLLIDVSGSMGSRMVEASTAVWVLKKSFDKLEIRTTAMGYDTSHHIFYQPNEKVPARIQVVNSMGGTNPYSALEQAMRIFDRTHKPNRLLVSVTDGGWMGDGPSLVAKMRKRGVMTMLLGLDKAVERYGSHNHEVARDLNRINELPKVVTLAVEGIIRQVTGQV